MLNLAVRLVVRLVVFFGVFACLFVSAVPAPVAPSFGCAVVETVRLHTVGVSYCESEYASATAPVLAAASAVRAAGGVPVVTLDLDETVQDSWLAQLEFSISGYSSSRYLEYIEAGLFPAVPGSVEFLSAVREAGIEVRFVTARGANAHAASVEALHGLGIEAAPEDVICTSGSRNKAAVFAALEADGYVIVAQAGDQARDFHPSCGLRIILPNLFYGENISDFR